jgi:hypothetical protein
VPPTGPSPSPPPFLPPPGPGFPLPAVPGQPPPPLPEPAPLPPFAHDPIRDLVGPVVDPALEQGLGGQHGRRSRLRARPPEGWSVASLLRAEAPRRHTPPPDVAYVDEWGLRVSVARVPGQSLPDAPPGTDLLARLRTVHRKLVPWFVHHPVDSTWQETAAGATVVDRFTLAPGGRVTGFSLATVTGPAEGLVAVGSAPPDRTRALVDVALPLAATARAEADTLVWAAPPGWWVTEELQISTASVLARVTLEPVGAVTDLPSWTGEVFDRAPFLRDMRTLGDRPVRVRGLDEARLTRFDWQPSGRGRRLTNVVTGLAGGLGFSFVVEVPFDGDALLLDPDVLLDAVEVLPDGPALPVPAPVLDLPAVRVTERPPSPRPSAPAPAPWTAPPRPTPPPPPVVGDRDRRLDAAVDRVLVAAVDVADGDPDAVAAPFVPGGIARPVDLDRLAVEAALDAVLRPSWPPLPWHDRPDTVAQVALRMGGWRGAAGLLAGATYPGQGPDLTGELWTTALLVAAAAREARENWVDVTSGLAGVLDTVRRGLVEHDAAWDGALTTVLVARPPRYRLKAMFDTGSGHLLWALDEETVRRWDHPVDHFDLPIPLPLAHRIQWLVDRHDVDSPDVGTVHRPSAPAERETFRRTCAQTLAELRDALGPAYTVEDRTGLGLG